MASNANPRPEGGAQGREGKRILRLRVSTVLTIFFLAVAAIALAYVGGVMSGRQTVSAPGRREMAKNAAPVEPPPAGEKSEPGILSARDLDYARVLRGEKARRPLRKESRPEAPVPEPGAAGGDGIALEEKTPAQATGDAPLATTPAPGESGQIPTPEKEADSALYDYVFQMGAFREESAADKLRQLLEGHGLRTLLERSGKMFIVLVRMRGDAERAGEVERIASELRLGNPVTRERKAVTR